MDKMPNYANTPEGRAQAKRLTECRIKLGCGNAKIFFEQYSQGRFSYTQYQKYESGERLLSPKAAILYASIFNVDWEWLQKGDSALEVKNFVSAQLPSNILDDIFEILETVDFWLKQNKKELDWESKKLLIKSLYEETVKMPQEERRANIISLTNFLMKNKAC